jgi:hypothetical protein
VANWLNGMHLLCFPLSQSESRKTSSWLLLLSLFSHTPKIKCYVLALAYSHQCTQIFSISSQSLLNHRLRKSVSVGINVSQSVGTQFTMSPLGDCTHYTPGEGKKAFKTHGSSWANQAVCRGKVLCILSIITLARTIPSVPSGTLVPTVPSIPSVPIHQKTIPSVSSDILVTTVTSVTTVPIHQKSIKSVPLGTLVTTVTTVPSHQKSIRSAQGRWQDITGPYPRTTVCLLSMNCHRVCNKGIILILVILIVSGQVSITYKRKTI